MVEINRLKTKIIMTPEERKLKKSIANKKYRENNKEKISIKRKKYYESNKDKIYITHRKYYEKNRERELLRVKKYCINNPEKVKECKKKSMDKNKEYYIDVKRKWSVMSNKRDRLKHRIRQREYRNTERGNILMRIYLHKRRIKHNSVENTITESEINKLYFLQNKKCGICGKRFSKSNRYTLDHIIPLQPEDGSKPEGLSFENTQLVCRGCNSRKRNKILPEYIVNWMRPNKLTNCNIKSQSVGEING
jgi:hypothetical protein